MRFKVKEKKKLKVTKISLETEHRNKMKNFKKKRVNDSIISLDELDYLINSGKYINTYYDVKKNNNIRDSPIVQKNMNKKKHKTIIDFLGKKKSLENSKQIVNQKKCPEKKKFLKSELINQYMSSVEPIKIIEKKKNENCKACHIEMIIVEKDSLSICPYCGYQENIYIDSIKPSYNEPPKEITYFAYKRINHFNEWLAQFQAKESTDIPKEIYKNVLNELKKERFTAFSKLTNEKLRKILKKIRCNKYYEHIPHIINNLTNKTPPILTREIEEKLRAMFREIQAPFIKHCPENRKNFLSYSYVLHKFIQLLSLDEYLICFPLLKSREKLYEQDKIWKKICKDTCYQYIKSI